MKVRSIELKLLKVLILLLPFHYLIFTILLKDNGFFKYWKDIIIIIVFITIILKQSLCKSRVRDKSINIYELSIVYFFIAIVFSFIFLTKSKADGLYMIRIYMEPFLAYYIAKKIYITEYEFEKLSKIMYISAIILSLYGLFQALILGDKFLIRLGYRLGADGRLTNPFYISGFGDFQRVVSTFVNPNTCAMYLSLILIFIFINSNSFKRKQLVNGVLLIITTIIFTFSRSAWIPLFIVILIMVKYLKKEMPQIKKIIFISLISLLILLILISIISDMNIFERIFEFIYRSITLKDTSADGRPEIWKYAFSIFKENIFGIGMGQTGAKASVLGNTMIAAESSYLTIMLDFGLQGIIIFVFMYIFSMYINFCNIKKSNKYSKILILNLGCMIATIMMCISMFFSNYVQDVELQIIYYLIIGFGSNKYLYTSIKDNI